MTLTGNESSFLHALRYAALTAVAAAGFFAATPARADIEGPAATQVGYAGTATINEGSSTGYSLTIGRTENVEIGATGTTTTRLGANTITFSRTGNSGLATQNVSAGGPVQGNQSYAGSFVYGQDGSHTVTFATNQPIDVVENSSYGIGTNNPTGSTTLSNSLTVLVLNVAPVIAGATQDGTDGSITVAEGSTVALRMTSTDPGADNQTFIINGGGAGIGGTSGTRTSSIVNQLFNQDGSFTNTFQVFDDDTSTTTTRSLVVTNVAPTIVTATQNSTNGNITVNEGTTVALVMTSTDPGADNQTFTINGGGAGIGGTSGTRTSSTVNVTYNNQGSNTNTFQVRDDDVTVGPITRTVTVNNVLPQALTLTVNSVAGNITITEGDAVTAQMTATDPGADFITFVIDGQAAGTGGNTPGSTRTSSALGLTNAGLLDEGTVNVSGTATDDVGPSSIGPRVVTILNAAPIQGAISGPGVVGYGNTVNYSVGATDVGILDNLTFEWDLDGDGFFDDFTDFQGAGGIASSTASFTGPAAPPSLITIGVRVSDGDGGFDTSFLTVLVPEPSSMALLGLGAVALAFATRRRKK